MSPALLRIADGRPLLAKRCCAALPLKPRHETFASGVVGVSMRNLVGSGVAFALAVAGVNLSPSPASARASDLIVHVYDIGQGSCVLIECPDDLPILVDCGKMKGGGGTIEAAARKINTVLDGYRDYYQPLRVILSHADVDHYSLLSGRDARQRRLLDPGKVRQVYFGGRYEDYGAAKAWISEAHQRLSFPSVAYPANRPCDDPNLRISCLTPNETAWGTVRGISCGTATIDLLTANAQAYYQANPTEFPGARWKSDGNKNADSAVVRVTYQGVSFIMTGDAQGITERMVMRNADASGVSLAGTGFLFASHHGADTHDSSGADWITATSPRNVVFSSNEGGGHGHPRCLTVRRFDDIDDAGLSDAPDGMDVPCDAGPGQTRFRNKFLITEANGDIMVTVSSTAPPAIECARMTKACAW